MEVMEDSHLMLHSNTDDINFISEVAAAIIEAILIASSSIANMMGWEELEKSKEYYEHLKKLYSIQK